MAAIVVKDLITNKELDREAMSVAKGGGGAPWVFGWISPYIQRLPDAGSFGQVINLFEITNNFYADQMNNQFQSVNVSNSAPNATVSVAASQVGANIKH